MLSDIWLSENRFYPQNPMVLEVLDVRKNVGMSWDLGFTPYMNNNGDVIWGTSGDLFNHQSPIGFSENGSKSSKIPWFGTVFFPVPG